MTTRITKSHRRLLDEIRRHGGLQCEHTKDGEIFSLLNGRRIDNRPAMSLINRRLILPSGDTIFGKSQTFRIAEEKDLEAKPAK